MNKKIRELREGLRLNIKKPPKVEVPKNIYTRKIKHKEGLEDKKFRPFLCTQPTCIYSIPSKSGSRIT